MVNNEEKLQGRSGDQNGSGQEGTATHSGWTHFYAAFSKHRDECIRLGKGMMCNNLQISTVALSEYHSALYSMAQQIFNFYGEEIETELTTSWLDLGDQVNDFLTKISDKDFRNQMVMEGLATIDKDLKVALLKYFNKVDRMAGNAGLLVGKEDMGASEPKKGLVGL